MQVASLQQNPMLVNAPTPVLQPPAPQLALQQATPSDDLTPVAQVGSAGVGVNS